MEIGHQFIRLKTACDSILAAFDLLGDRHPLPMGPGAGSLGVAIDASAGGKGAVAVGAVQSGVDGDLVDAAAEPCSKVGVQIPVWFFLGGHPVLDLDIAAII